MNVVYLRKRTRQWPLAKLFGGMYFDVDMNSFDRAKLDIDAIAFERFERWSRRHPSLTKSKLIRDLVIGWCAEEICCTRIATGKIKQRPDYSLGDVGFSPDIITILPNGENIRVGVKGCSERHSSWVFQRSDELRCDYYAFFRVDLSYCIPKVQFVGWSVGGDILARRMKPLRNGSTNKAAIYIEDLAMLAAYER